MQGMPGADVQPIRIYKLRSLFGVHNGRLCADFWAMPRDEWADVAPSDICPYPTSAVQHYSEQLRTSSSSRRSLWTMRLWWLSRLGLRSMCAVPTVHVLQRVGARVEPAQVRGRSSDAMRSLRNGMGPRTALRNPFLRHQRIPSSLEARVLVVHWHGMGAANSKSQ